LYWVKLSENWIKSKRKKTEMLISRVRNRIF
jgi:hypothetical protein